MKYLKSGENFASIDAGNAKVSVKIRGVLIDSECTQKEHDSGVALQLKEKEDQDFAEAVAESKKPNGK